MKNLEIPKSKNKLLKANYEILTSVLVPDLLKRIGFPELMVDTVKEGMSKTTDLLFENQGFREMMQNIVKASMEELMEREDENSPLRAFISAIISEVPQSDVPYSSESYRNYLKKCHLQWKSDHVTTDCVSSKKLNAFADELSNKVLHKIAQDDELEKYRLIVKTAKKVEDVKRMIDDIQAFLLAQKLPIDDNAAYRKKYFENLCMHRGDTPVALADIFVMPEVDVNKKRLPVGNCVKEFIASKKQKILLLLGHGGYGKTSFVAHMAANETTYTDGRPLHIFRLREFSKSSVGELSSNIKEKIENFDQIAPNAVLVFDGLDELCMIGGMIGETDEMAKSLVLLEQLTLLWAEKENCKMIVTSRPQYINADRTHEKLLIMGVDKENFTSFCYCSFDKKQRTELKEKIELADPTLKNNTGCTQIQEGGDEAIYGSPFILYLICAGDKTIAKECFSNRWLLFRTVFHDIIPRPKHKSLKDNNTDQGKVVREHGEKLYRITCHLAHRIYKTGYTKQYFKADEVKEIIRNLYPTEKQELLDDLQNCYALCAYFSQKEDGAVEFAHNHVRDFFLCEYILQGLDDCYAKRPEMTAEECGKQVADWLSNNLKYAETTVKTDDFLSRAVEQKGEACPHVEQHFKANELKYVFNVFCRNGGLHEYHADDMAVSVRSAAKNVIRNSAFFLKTLLPQIDGLIVWFDMDKFNAGERYIIEQMKKWLEYADLSGAVLNNINLNGAELCGAELSYAHLSDVNLNGANLNNANMVQLYLSGSVLRDANLSNTTLIGAILTDVNMIDANLTKSHLIDANLRNAILVGTNLREADLSGADLTCALYDNYTRFPKLSITQKVSMKKVK